MQTQIRKWGNTLVVCLPEPVIEKIHWHQGTSVDISVVEDQIIIDGRLAKEEMTLDALLSEISAENIHQEIDTGSPLGNEVW